jgi:hypothetical protein
MKGRIAGRKVSILFFGVGLTFLPVRARAEQAYGGLHSLLASHGFPAPDDTSNQIGGAWQSGYDPEYSVSGPSLAPPSEDEHLDGGSAYAPSLAQTLSEQLRDRIANGGSGIENIFHGTPAWNHLIDLTATSAMQEFLDAHDGITGVDQVIDYYNTPTENPTDTLTPTADPPLPGVWEYFNNVGEATVGNINEERPVDDQPWLPSPFAAIGTGETPTGD